MGNNAIGYKGRQLLTVLWVETGIAFAIISLRYYTRRFVGGRVGPDDYILMVTWVRIQNSNCLDAHMLTICLQLLMCAFSGLISASVHYGMGIHVQFLDIEQITRGILMLLIGQCCIAIAMGLSKCAVAVFLTRIVTTTW